MIPANNNWAADCEAISVNPSKTNSIVALVTAKCFGLATPSSGYY